MFLFCDDKLFGVAYLITPDDEGEDIQHQYGCVGCCHFEIKGKVETIEPYELADKIEDVMDGLCMYGDERNVIEEFEKLTGWPVERVLGEALIKLKDGRYVAVNNCD